MAAGTFAQASFSAVFVGLPALAPALRSHYALSLSAIGLALSAVGMGMVVTLLPWGLLADRVGERVVIGLGLSGAAGALGAAATTHRVTTLVALLFTAGMFGACVNAASGRAIMGWFGAGERGVALGIRQTGIPLGGAAGAVALPYLDSLGGIRLALAALAGGCVLGGLLAVLLLRERVTTAPRDIGGARQLAVRPALRARDRRMWILAGGSALYMTAQIAITGFVVLFLHDRRHLATSFAADVLAVINVLGVAMRIGVGRWSDMLGARIRPLQIIGFALAAAIAAVAALVDSPLIVLIPALVICGAIGLGWNGLSFVAAAEYLGPDRSGAALGFQQTVVNAMAAIVPLLFVGLLQVGSWRFAFAVSALGPLLGAAALRILSSWGAVDPHDLPTSHDAHFAADALAERPQLP